jgi:hypothetical protein
MSELEIFKIDLDLEFSDILALKRRPYQYSIAQDCKADFILLASKEYLYFCSSLQDAIFYNKQLEENHFQAELWRQDLSEIFFAQADGKAYQEFNFSPAGAYWQTQLSDYREKIVETETPVPGLEVTVSRDNKTQIILAKIPIASIFGGLQVGSRINCTAIIGELPRNYFSCAELNPAKIDFHRIELWPKVKFSTLTDL